MNTAEAGQPPLLQEILADLNLFFSHFYAQSSRDIPCPSGFVMHPESSLGSGGQVLFQEQEDGVDLGLRFGCHLVDAFLQGQIGDHELGVVAEEVSHFRLIAEAAERESTLSPLDLEVWGEIDRFITLLVWPSWSKLAAQTAVSAERSVGPLCETLFSERGFDRVNASDLHLYFKAESLALKHIQRAFPNGWSDNSTPAFHDLQQARRYFSGVQQLLAVRGVSARLILEGSGQEDAWAA